jgi:hypothetical protein
MANCPKCHTIAEQPLKTWKIKQTPLALYECPTCKARWRNKLLAKAAVVIPEKPPEIAAVGRTEVEVPVRPVSTIVAAAPTTSSPFTGIRRFFSSILNL